MDVRIYFELRIANRENLDLVIIWVSLQQRLRDQQVTHRICVLTASGVLTHVSCSRKRHLLRHCCCSRQTLCFCERSLPVRCSLLLRLTACCSDCHIRYALTLCQSPFSADACFVRIIVVYTVSSLLLRLWASFDLIFGISIAYSGLGRWSWNYQRRHHSCLHWFFSVALRCDHYLFLDS